ncbi:MAG: ABC transporter permease [Methylococcus sp.]|nr:ABC transporter permease [Methylococcus sp.]
MILKRAVWFIRGIFRAFFGGLVDPFRIAVRERELLYLLIRRDFVARTSGTVIGWGWMIAQPALQVVGFWFLLELVLQVRLPGRVSYLEYYLTGILPWLMLNEILMRSVYVLDEFSPIFKKSRFPLSVLPLVPVLSAGMIHASIFALVAGALGGLADAATALALSAGMLLWLLPAAYLFSITGVMLRDFRQILPFLLNLAMYVTPIMYLPEMLPQAIKPALAFNPFADLMALIHAGLQGLSWDSGNVFRPVVLWAVLLLLSRILFRRAEPYVREML